MPRKIRVCHIDGCIVQVTPTYRADTPVFVEVETDLTDKEVLDGQMVAVAAVLSARAPMPVPAEITAAPGEHIDIAIPDPCVVTIDGERIDVRGGNLGFTAPTPPDVYPITLSAWPWLDATVMVTVVAPETP